MQAVKQLGDVNWTDEDIKDSIPEFLELYSQKPIDDNQGGMKSPHMLATWFLLKKINPKNVIESGIWKGQGTWLIEKTLPEANVFSLDINLSRREYTSDRVQYFERDFTEVDWSVISDKANTVLFFDDHQNALNRIKKGSELGFRHFIFEDNYPAMQGDCYSLKKAFQHAGFDPDPGKRSIKQWIKSFTKPSSGGRVSPNSRDDAYLKDALKVYYEFPPVFVKDTTRWGDAWNEEHYPTPSPLFTNVDSDHLKLFYEEAKFYTWICYAAVK